MSVILSAVLVRSDFFSIVLLIPIRIISLTIVFVPGFKPDGFTEARNITVTRDTLDGMPV